MWALLLLVGVWPGGQFPRPHPTSHGENRVPPDTMVPNVLMSAPASWKPFTSNSPWNQTIKMAYGDPEPIHPNSAAIIAKMAADGANGAHLKLNSTYNPTMWWVPTDEGMTGYTVRTTSHIYDAWDQTDDRVSDILVPFRQGTMYPENTGDAHIAIVCQRPCVHIPNTCGGVWQDLQIIPDSSVIEMSHFNGAVPCTCSTFNVWDYRNDYLHGYIPGGGSLSDGYQPYPLPPGAHRTVRGGRGGGTPCFAGLLRPEEVLAGNTGAPDSLITHALSFNSQVIRKGPVQGTPQEMFLNPPCVRSDAPNQSAAPYGEDCPLYGTLIQLDPALSDASILAWFDQGTAPQKNCALRVAHALQTYGAYLVDWGGPNGIFVQNLYTADSTNQQRWEARVPKLYHNINQIPTTAFRVIYTGDSTVIAQ